MSEGNADIEPQVSISPLQRAVEYHQQLGGSPELRDKAKEMQRKLAKAIDLIAGDSTKPLNKDREEKVLEILTGVNYLANDPHKLETEAGAGLVSPRDSVRLANFVRAVNRLGTVNQDESVTLNLSLESHPTVHPVRVPPTTK